MGKITVYEKDYKIETDEGKIFGVYKSSFLNLNTYNINLNFRDDEIYNNDFLNQLDYYYNNPFYLKYLDANYGLDKSIRFEYYTYIGDKSYLITPDFIYNLKENGGGDYEIILYLYDIETKFYYEIGYIKMSLGHNPGGFFESGYKEIILKGEIYLNTDNFIKEISKKYFGRLSGNEEFDFK